MVDNSGVRLYYTEQLRQHDAAYLTIGHLTSAMHVIPPNKNWTSVGICSSDCTNVCYYKHIFKNKKTFSNFILYLDH